MTREQLKALIVEVLATATASFIDPEHAGKPRDMPWQRHWINTGDRGHTYDDDCALCRKDIPALAEALVDAIEIRREDELR